MKEVFKKYWPHLIGYITLGSLLIFTIFLNQPVLEFNEEVKLVSRIITIVLVLCVIGVIFETKYFYNKATFGGMELKHYDLNMFFVKNFGIFYAPCFNLTHVVKDEKHKSKNFIYLLTTISMSIGIILVLINFFSTPHYEIHTSYDDKYKVEISWDYKKVDTEEEEDYFEKTEKNITFVNFNNPEITSDTVINTFIEYGKENEKDFKEIENNTTEIDNKNITSYVYEMIEDDKKITEVYTTITFDNLDTYIISIYYRGYSDNYDKQELKDIYKSIELKE